MADIIYLSAIYLYPVKSLAGIRVNAWQVTRTGLQYDRQAMLIDRQGQFLSQRTLPRMALIQTAFSEGQLVLSAPSQASISLPLQVQGGASVPCVIWQDSCAALHVSAEVDAWLSDFLHYDCRLVTLPADNLRQVDTHYAQVGDYTAFSDGFPFLIVSEASLTALNSALPVSVDMRRFRPNLVLAGCDSYQEDGWREIAIGQIGFRLPKPCSRCSIPALNPDNACPDKAVLTLLNHRRRWENKLYFGQNALHNQQGSLRVGDAVQIIQKGPLQPPLSV